MCPSTRNRTPKSVRITPSDIANSRVLEPEVLRVYGSKEPVTPMKAKIRQPTYELLNGKTHLRYQDIGHMAGDLMWWIDNSGIIQWQSFDGVNHHHDMSPLDMDARWRGRLELGKSGTATLLPPIKLYSRKPDDLMSHLPIGAMITLNHLGAKRFYLDTARGLVRLKRSTRSRQKDTGKNLA